MSLLHFPHNFKLEIYNHDLGEYVKCPKNIFPEAHLFYQGNGFLQLLEMPATHTMKLLGKDFDHNHERPVTIVKHCIKKGYINKHWLACAKWFVKTNKQLLRAHKILKLYPNPFLYRSIEPNKYKLLIKLGSITAQLNKEFEDKWFKEANLPRSEYIWAEENINKPWEFAHKENPSIIIIYRKKYFTLKKIKNNRYPGIWQRKHADIRYTDTVEAIIKVRYEY